MPNDPTVTFTNIYGQGRVNQLGGVFINGRPLPFETRKRIVDLFLEGVKPCNISRDLRVSHGAVSKILNRYNQTGSISPGQIGGNPRSRCTIQSVEQDIYRLKKDQPQLSAVEIRQQLIKNGICAKKSAPSEKEASSILNDTPLMVLTPSTPPTSTGSSTNKLKYSIDSILNFEANKISPNDTASSSNSNTSISHFSSILSSNSDEENNCGILIPTTRDTPSTILANNTNNNNNGLESGSESSSSRDLNSPEAINPHQMPSENRRNRTSFTSQQLNILETYFARNTYPSAAEREFLVKQTNLDEDKIITWFSNRRARNRKLYTSTNHTTNSVLPLNPQILNPTTILQQPSQIINPILGNSVMSELLQNFNNANQNANNLALIQNQMLAANPLIELLKNFYSNQNCNISTISNNSSSLQQQQQQQQQQLNEKNIGD